MSTSLSDGEMADEQPKPAVFVPPIEPSTGSIQIVDEADAPDDNDDDDNDNDNDNESDDGMPDD